MGDEKPERPRDSAAERLPDLPDPDVDDLDGDPERIRDAVASLRQYAEHLEDALRSLEQSELAPSGDASAEAPASGDLDPHLTIYRPASVHFDERSISSKIDPYAVPPPLRPRPPSYVLPRIALEASFLIFVAIVAAALDLRPLLILASELTAFLIVVAIELSLTRERRSTQLPLLAPPPVPQRPPAADTEMPPAKDVQPMEPDIEPLVWESEGLLGAEAEPSAESENGPRDEIPPGGETKGELLVGPERSADLALEAPREAEPQAEGGFESALEAADGVRFDASADAVAKLEPPSETVGAKDAEVDLEPEPQEIPPLVSEAEIRPPAEGPTEAAESAVELEHTAEIEPVTAPVPEPEPVLEPVADEEPETMAAAESELEAAEERPKRRFLRRRRRAPQEAPDDEGSPELVSVAAPESEPEVDAPEPESEVELSPELVPEPKLEPVALVDDTGEFAQLEQLLALPPELPAGRNRWRREGVGEEEPEPETTELRATPESPLRPASDLAPSETPLEEGPLSGSERGSELESDSELAKIDAQDETLDTSVDLDGDTAEQAIDSLLDLSSSPVPFEPIEIGEEGEGEPASEPGLEFGASGRVKPRRYRLFAARSKQRHEIEPADIEAPSDNGLREREQLRLAAERERRRREREYRRRQRQS